MPLWYRFFRLGQWIVVFGLGAYASAAGAHADLHLSGRVVDSNGNPVDNALVTIYLASGHGPELITLMTSEGGVFSTPGPVSVDTPDHARASVRKMGYEQVHQSYVLGKDKQKADITLIVRPVINRPGTAPASAWLQGMAAEKRAELVHNCVGCHQMPDPKVLDYARLIEESIAGLSGVDPEDAHRQSWTMIEQYMAALTDQPAARSNGQTSQYNASAPLASGGTSALANTLARLFTGPKPGTESHNNGAPLPGAAQTVINEYKLRDVDSGRGAVLLGSPPKIWTTASGTNDALISVNLETGELNRFQLPPGDGPAMAPTALQRGTQGTLWITSASEGQVAQFDTLDEKWLRVLKLSDKGGSPPKIHALGLGANQEVKADKQGNIWFSDNTRNTLGYFSPDTGITQLFLAPKTPGQSASANTYSGRGGVFISPDGQSVWFSQPESGAIGTLDTERFQFSTVVFEGTHASPQSLSMQGKNILYVPLLGTGQLLEYNTSTGERTLHDLPDRASAPDTALYDPIRNVVWVATLNGDSIYSFDPVTREFALLPFPRQGTYLKDFSLDPKYGMLVGLYSQHGLQDWPLPVLLTIDIGDGMYPDPILGATEELNDNAM